MLYQLCKANVRAMDSSDPQPVEEVQGKVCEAYISGFVDGIAMGNKVICVNGATLGTLSRVYVTYMEQNPKLMDMQKYAGLYAALAVSYPCSALTK